MEAKQAPLIERLKKVPADARLIYEHDQFHSQSIPVGALCAEAASLIEQLRREAHPAITHCDNCGCDWLDNGLNPVGCPYCKLSAETEASIDAMLKAREASND